MIEAADNLMKLGQPLKDAIKILNQGVAHIALVIDENGHLKGTVTDGDIRRGLLRGETLDATVECVMCREFQAISISDSEAMAKKLMQKMTLRQMPVVDELGHVIGVHLIDEPAEVLPNWVVLMAGGSGKRLRPHTEACPKPMLHVNGRPMLEIILEQCLEAGFRKFFIAVHYLKESLMEYFEDGGRWGVSIQYLEETVPLGTAGALGLLPERPTAPVLVLNGDVLTRVDFSSLMQFHQDVHSMATVCVRRQEMQMPFGVIQLEGESVSVLEEKPTLVHQVNAGMYVLNPEVCELLPWRQRCDMTELLNRAISKNFLVSAFPVHEYWEDVGHPERWNRAQADWQN